MHLIVHLITIVLSLTVSMMAFPLSRISKGPSQLGNCENQTTSNIDFSTGHQSSFAGAPELPTIDVHAVENLKDGSLGQPLKEFNENYAAKFKGFSQEVFNSHELRALSKREAQWTQEQINALAAKLQNFANQRVAGQVQDPPQPCCRLRARDKYDLSCCKRDLDQHFNKRENDATALSPDAVAALADRLNSFASQVYDQAAAQVWKRDTEHMPTVSCTA